MSKLNELAVIDTNTLRIVPTEDELAAITHELEDMGTLPFGRIQIAVGGAGVFQVTEPGEDDASIATEIKAVIIASHDANVLWLGKFGSTEDRTPDCVSPDGTEGHVRETGELLQCAACKYNQYGTADNGERRGKACKNTRRLYLMRSGDVFPMVLTLPPTALETFKKYRTMVAISGKPMHGVMTKITLKPKENYSTPVFEAYGLLPPAEAERVRQYTSGFINAMAQSALSVDNGEVGSVAPSGAISSSGDESLPFGD